MIAMELPGWAVDHARAALSIGMKVPEVEQRLVAKGLTAAQANDVVMRIVEGRVHNALAPAESQERSLPVQLVLSVVVAAVCLALAYWFGGAMPAVWTLACILPGLAGILLPEMMHWKWGLSGAGCRAVGWVWLLLFGAGRVLLIAIFNQPV
jgi:hypothetical protein